MAGKTKKAATITVAPIPKIHLSMPLDDKKIKAIQKCIEKGTLEVTINRVNLAAGEVGDSWLYD
jgi:anti-sigma28 factor (negative regulator of flagellin synthesis)